MHQYRVHVLRAAASAERDALPVPGMVQSQHQGLPIEPPEAAQSAGGWQFGR